MEQELTKNAIDFIRQSNLYHNNRYNWLKDVIVKLLNDKLKKEDITNLIHSELNITNSDEKVKENDTQESKYITVDSEGLDEKTHQQIKKLISIDEASNIGLLDMSKPIPLFDGLNIFYGKNGAGKSSLYFALCKTLGFEKQILPNINLEDSKCSFKIRVIDDNNVEQDICWETGKTNYRMNVKIFDNSISNFLVEKDQLNQFEIAHLKSEYFSFLHSLFDNIAGSIAETHEKVTDKQKTTNEIISNNVPEFFEQEESIWTKEKIEKMDFSKEDEKKLSNLGNKIDTLEKKETEAIVSNLITARKQIEIILTKLGSYEKVQKEEESKEPEIKWTLKYNKEFFENLNQEIRNYNQARKAFEQQGVKILSSQVPKDWISNDNRALEISPVREVTTPLTVFL